MNNKDIKFRLIPEVDEPALGKAKSKMNFGDSKVKVDFDVSDAHKDFEKLKNEAASLGTQLGNIDKVAGKSILDKLATVGLAMQGIQQVTGALNDLSAPYVALDKATQSMKTLGDEAAAMAPRLRGAAIAMSKELPFGAASIQSAMTDALASGVQGGEEGLKKFAETAAKLAVGGGAELGAVVQGLGATLNAFGETSEKTGQYADWMFNIVNAGVTTIDDLNQYLSGVTPTAASMGLAFDKVGGALALMTQKGVPTASAVTKLNALLIEMAKPTAGIRDALDAAGVSMDDFHKMIADDNIVGALQTLQAGFTKAGKSATQAFSSSEAGAAFNVLMGDVGMFNETLEMVSNTTGSTEFAYQQMAETIEVRTQKMRAKLDAFLIGLADSTGIFGEMAIVGSQAFASVAPTLTAFASIKSLLPTEAIANFGKTLITKLIPSLIATATAQAGVTTATAVTSTAFTSAGVAGVASGTATQAAWLPVIAPFLAIGAAITAIIGGFYLLYKNSEGFKNVVDKTFGVIKSLATEVFGVISSIGSTLWEVGKTIFSVLVAPIQVAFHTISEIFGTLTSIISDAISTVFSGNTSNAFSGMFDGLKSAIIGIGDLFKPVQETISTVIEYVKIGISAVIQAIKPFAEFFAGSLAVGFKLMYEAVKVVVQLLLSGAVGAFTGLFKVLKWIGGIVKDILVGAFEKISGFLKNITSGMSSTTSSGSAMAKIFGVIASAVQLLFSPFTSLYNYFKKAGDMGTYVKGVMSGLSETFNTFKNILGRAWSALTSLDIKGFTSALGNMPKELANGFDKGFNAALDKEKAKQKAKETAQAVADEAKKENAKIEEESKKADKKRAESKEKVKLEILKQYEASKKSLEIEQEKAELASANLLAEKGISKTAKDDLASQEAKIGILKQQQKMLEDIANNYAGTIKGDAIVGLKLDKENTEKLTSEYKKVVDDLAKAELVKKGLDIKLNIETESAKKELKELENKKLLENYKMYLEIGLITNTSYNEKVKEVIKSEIDDLNQELKGLDKLKLEFVSDDKKVLEIQKDIDKISDAINKKNEELRKANEGLADAMFYDSLAFVQDLSERERKIRLYEIAKAYNEQLQLAKGNKNAELKVIEDFVRKEAEINEEYMRRNMDTKTQTLLMFTSALQNSLSNLSIADNSNEIEQAKSRVSEIDEQMKLLDEAYKNGEKSYADYINELNALDEERAEAKKKSNMSMIDFEKTMATALADSFKSVAESSQANIAKMTEQYQLAINDTFAIQEKIKTTFDPTELNSLYDALAAKNAEASAAMASAWVNFGTNVGAVFAQMLASGNSFLKSTVVAALAGLKAIIPILIAEIYAKEIASKSFAGIATAAGLTALLMGVVSAAEAGVKKLKFAEGGEIPGGAKSIWVNEEGTEFVVNHKAYAMNKKALQEINRRRITIEQYAREKQYVAPGFSKEAEQRLAKMENVLYNVVDAVNKVERAVHSTTHRNESVVKMEFNDKELVSRYDTFRANKVRGF